MYFLPMTTGVSNVASPSWETKKWFLNVTASTSDWMERHVFPADDNRCQQRCQPQLRAGTNHRMATSNCTEHVRNTLSVRVAGHCRLKICEDKSVLAGVCWWLGDGWWFIVNTNACRIRKFMLQICLSYLQLLIMNISFVSMISFSQCQVCFSNGYFGCCSEIFFFFFSHIQHLVCIKMCLSINDISLVVNTIYHEGLT
jgi:hypothetical protein